MITKPKARPPETDEDLEDDDEVEAEYFEETPLYDPEDVGR